MASKIEDSFSEHIIGVIIDLLDLEPMQQHYRDDVLMKEDDSVDLIQFLQVVAKSKRLRNMDRLLSLENFLDDLEIVSQYAETHPNIEIPYGPAVVALFTDNETIKHYKLHLHSNPGIRLLVAYASSDEEILDLLSYDRCVLVRNEVQDSALERDKVKEALGRLSLDPFLFVRKQHRNLGPIESSVSDSLAYFPLPPTDDLIYSFDLSECSCFEAREPNDEFHEFFSEFGIETPIITRFFEEEITHFGYWHWATQPFPDRLQDYLMESVDYLKGPIPNQYSINHAGHGINSYSLNFRCAIGNIAILAQVGWGGAYMDTQEQSDRWDYVVQILNTILLENSSWETDEIFVRKYLILSSDFRLEHPQLWKNENGTWTLVEDIESLEEITQYLSENNEIDPEYRKMYVEE